MILSTLNMTIAVDSLIYFCLSSSLQGVGFHPVTDPARCNLLTVLRK
jgi:hypothetical protein